jgi:broad specificity phosphatase PhoE
MVHATAIAAAVLQDVKASTSSEEEVVHVYSSPFTRTTQTANIIASALPCLESQVRVEEGLTEWQQKSLLVDPSGTITYPYTAKEISADFSKVDVTYESVNPQGSCHPSPAVGGVDDFVEESEQDLFERCSKTLEGILNERADGLSFVIVSHAPCDQSMGVYFEGTTLKDSSLGPWPLGGITKFSRVKNDDGSFGSWEMDYYGATDHMPGEYKGGLKAWSLPTLSR